VEQKQREEAKTRKDTNGEWDTKVVFLKLIFNFILFFNKLININILIIYLFFSILNKLVRIGYLQIH